MVYRVDTGQNSSTLDTLNRLTFVPAKYAKERPTYRHIESNTVVLLDGNKKDADKEFVSDETESSMGRRESTRVSHRPKTRSQDELFPREDLSLEWRKIRRVGSGLNNLGNTCFMNSVLQCLIHTPPLAELLLSKRTVAYRNAAHGELDPIGMTQTLIRESLEGKRDCISPVQHAKSLKRINRWFRLGRQEDAHEYLIALLDAMHDRSIAGMNPKPSRELEYTSFIYQIFGGKIRSQLKCTQCDYESNTYDPFLDLSLEISRAHSVQKALQRFTTGEVLDGQNSYKCPKQNKMVRAVKRMTIEDIPNILIIQLKRFEFSRSGRKISKHVDFDQTLDLSPYMSDAPEKGSALYELYGVLVHQGYSMHSGHYFCYLKGTGGGEWHKFDDTRVHATSARNAMGQSPYILFYTRKAPVVEHHVDTVAAKQSSEKIPKKTKRKKDRGEEEKMEEEEVTKHAKEDANAKAVAESVEKKPVKGSRSPKMSKKHITRPLSLTPLARSKLSQGRTVLLPRTRLRSNGQKQSLQTPMSTGTSKKRSTTPVENGPSSKRKKRESDVHTMNASTGAPPLSVKGKKRGTEALQKYKTHTVGMGLDNWDDIDTDMKKRRDRNVRKTVVPRRQLDEYDADYDKGRTKKVKNKSKIGRHITSAAYDAVAKQLSKAKRLFGK